MKKILICAALVMLSANLQAASFDCVKASTAIEKSICGDEELSDLDSKLTQVYKKSLADSTNSDALKSEQRAWLKDVRNKCEDSACLKRAYSDRITNLSPVPESAPPAVSSSSQQESSPEATQSSSASNHASSAPASATEPVAVTAPAPVSSSLPAEVKQSVEAAMDTQSEPPNAGISGLFNAVYFVLVAVFIVGLVKPQLVLRWDSTPTRKKLIGYFLVVALPVGLLGQFTKNDAMRDFEAKVRAEQEAERQAAIEEKRRVDDEKAALQPSRRTSATQGRAASVPVPLWMRYYMAINANGTACEQYKSVIENWHQSGIEENQLNQQAANLFAQAKQAGCVQ